MGKMKFEPIYFSDKLHVVNPFGTIGIITLWSSIKFVMAKLSNAGIDLNSETSKIAVFGNLYGEGFPYLLRNLLYNPQILTVIITGSDRSGSASYLSDFISLKAGSYTADNLIKPKMLDYLVVKQLEFDEIAQFLKLYIPPEGTKKERINIPVPVIKLSTFPSNVRGHQILASSPREAWEMLIHQIFRFGTKVQLKKGERLELQNMKVVVESSTKGFRPFQKYGFDPDSFEEYQKAILEKIKPPDLSYTYGNRIREHFGTDFLLNAVKEFRNSGNQELLFSLWDNKTDMATAADAPCFAFLFLRKQDGILHLTAEFRTHNALQAWPKNFFGLTAIQNFIASESNLGLGSITIFSLSISLDPMYLERAKIIFDEINTSDAELPFPNSSNLLISIENREIVVKNYVCGVAVEKFHGKRPEGVQHQLARNGVIQDFYYAMYIGRQLEKAYQCIKAKKEYIQE